MHTHICNRSYLLAYRICSINDSKLLLYPGKFSKAHVRDNYCRDEGLAFHGDKKPEPSIEITDTPLEQEVGLGYLTNRPAYPVGSPVKTQPKDGSFSAPPQTSS